MAPAVVPFRVRWFAVAALAFLALAVYGSLVPLRFQVLPWEEVLRRWRQISFHPMGLDKRSDFVANILLFIPLAWFFMGALCVDRRRSAGLCAFLLVAPLCAALSVGIEFVQIYFPPRTVSLNDIAAESAGACLGCLLWLGAGQRSTDWARGLWTNWSARGLAARILPGYLAALVVIHLMPFDLTISPVEVFRKYRDGKIALLPFTTYASPSQFLDKTFWNVCYFLPAGVLLAYLPAGGRPRGGERRAWLGVLGLGAALAATVEFMQIFVFTRYFDTTDIVTGSLAVLAGWSLALAFRRTEMPAGLVRRLWLPAWLLLAVYFTWQPFDFVLDSSFAHERLARVSVVPFSDYYAGTEYNAFDQFLRKALLFAPLGVLLAWSLSARLPGMVVLLGAMILAAVLEAGQLFLPDRYASATDVLVESVGAWLGYWLTARFLRQLSGRPQISGQRQMSGQRLCILESSGLQPSA